MRFRERGASIVASVGVDVDVGMAVLKDKGGSRWYAARAGNPIPGRTRPDEIKPKLGKNTTREVDFT